MAEGESEAAKATVSDLPAAEQEAAHAAALGDHFRAPLPPGLLEKYLQAHAPIQPQAPRPAFSWSRNVNKALGQIGYGALIVAVSNPDFIPQALALIPEPVRPVVGILVSAIIVSARNWSKHRGAGTT